MVMPWWHVHEFGEYYHSIMASTNFSECQEANDCSRINFIWWPCLWNMEAVFPFTLHAITLQDNVMGEAFFSLCQHGKSSCSRTQHDFPCTILKNVRKYLSAGTSLKPVFHFNGIVTYRNIFFCIEVISSTLVLTKQRNTLRYGTV